jgi:hypothetical protein
MKKLRADNTALDRVELVEVKSFFAVGVLGSSLRMTDRWVI